MIQIQTESRQTEAETNRQLELTKPLRKTTHRTIRLDEEVASIIAEQARQERTTDIQVIERAVDSYAHWHLWEEKFEFISVPSSMEHKLMSFLTDGQARELGRHLAETFARDFVRYVFKTPNLANVLAPSVTSLVPMPTSSHYKNTAQRTTHYRFSTTEASRFPFSGRK